MNNPTYAVDWAAESRFEHIKDLDLQSVDAADIQLVIGVDSYFLQAVAKDLAVLQLLSEHNLGG